MTQRADVELRIRSKNLASKSLREVNEELDALVKNQERQADSAVLASRSLKDLNAEQRALVQTGAELRRQQGVVERFIGSPEKIAAQRANVEGLRKSLDELLAGKAAAKAAKTPLAAINEQIRDTKKALNEATRSLTNQENAYDRLTESLAQVGVTSENAESALREIAAASAKAEQATRGATAAVAGHADAQKAVVAALEARQAKEREIAAEIQRRAAVEAEAAAKRESAARAEINDFARLKNAAAVSAASSFNGPDFAAFEAERKALERINGVRARLAEWVEKNNAQEARYAGTVRQGVAATRTSAHAQEQHAAAIRKAVVQLGLFNDVGRKSLSVYQRMRGQILQIGAAYLGVYQAVSLVQKSFEATQTREGIEIKLRVANKGDQQAAIEDFKFLRSEADALGIRFTDLSKKYADYKIAATSVGVSNELIRSSFSDVAKSIAVNRLSADDADGVLRAMVQVMSKARVQAEELRGQLGDRLPGAVAAFAEANRKQIGGGIEKLDEYLKKGKAGVNDFLRFLREYASQVDSELPAATKTAQASLNRLKNAFDDFLVTLGESGLTDALKKVFDQMSTFFKSKDGEQTAQALGRAFAALGDVFLFVVENLDRVIIAVKVFLGLQIIKAVAGTVVGFNDFRMAAIGLATAMRGAATGTGLMAVASRGLMAALGPVGLALTAAAGAYYVFTRDQEKAIASTEKFTNRLQQLKAAQGDAIVDQIANGRTELAAKRKELAGLEAKLKTAQKEEAKASSFGTLISRLGLSESSASILSEKVKEARVQVEGLEQGLGNAMRRHMQFLADRGKTPEIPDVAVPEDTTEDDKKKADAAAKLAEQIAAKRLAIEHRAADAVLDLDKEIAQNKIEASVVSQEQIEANYTAQLAVIDAEIKKKRADLDKLKADAEALKSAPGVASADDALRKLDVLDGVLRKKAEEEAMTARINMLEKELTDTISKRDAEISLINDKVQLGLMDEVQGRQQVIDKQEAYKTKILDTVTLLRAALEALPPDLFARLGGDKLIAQLDAAVVGTTRLRNGVESVKQAFGKQFAAGVSNAFAVMAQGFAGAIEGANSWTDAFKNAGKAFQQFVSDFLIQIGQAILQAIILKAIMDALGYGTGGTYGEAVQGALAGMNHTGGMAGKAGHKRWVDPAVFAGAQKFHGGGLPGLRPNEVPSILEKGEEVLTRDDPRHVLNGGMGGGSSAPQEITVINQIESGSVVAEGLNTPAGKKAFYNYMRANQAGLRKLLVG